MNRILDKALGMNTAHFSIMDYVDEIESQMKGEGPDQELERLLAEEFEVDDSNGDDDKYGRLPESLR